MSHRLLHPRKKKSRCVTPGDPESRENMIECATEYTLRQMGKSAPCIISWSTGDKERWGCCVIAKIKGHDISRHCYSIDHVMTLYGIDNRAYNKRKIRELAVIIENNERL